MKKRYIVLLTFLGIFAAILFHFGATLLFQVVSNYEALSIIELSGVPMFMFIAAIITVMFYLYRALVLKRNNPYTKKLYAMLIMIFTAVGFVSAILVGVVVYHNLFARYVFIAYPFVMMIANLVSLAASIYYFVIAKKQIKEEQPEKPARSSAKHVFATIGFTFIILYSFVKFGSLFLLPILYSPTDGYLAIPFYIQCLVPLAALVVFLVYRDVLKPENKGKFGIIANSIIFGFSICTFVYMYIVTKYTYPGMINALSNNLHMERLVTFPINFIILYVLSIVLPFIYLIKALVRKIKNRK